MTILTTLALTHVVYEKYGFVGNSPLWLLCNSIAYDIWDSRFEAQKRIISTMTFLHLGDERSFGCAMEANQTRISLAGAFIHICYRLREKKLAGLHSI